MVVLVDNAVLGLCTVDSKGGVRTVARKEWWTALIVDCCLSVLWWARSVEGNDVL